MYKKPVISFTKAGFSHKEKEYTELIEKRVAAVLDLKKAREMGDLSENGYYKAARFNLSSIDRRLRELRYMLQYGQIIVPSSADTVQIGASIMIQDNDQTKTYMLVGNYEANPKEMKISTASPLGRNLLGRKVGETILLQTPTGEKTVKILRISSNTE